MSEKEKQAAPAEPAAPTDAAPAKKPAAKKPAAKKPVAEKPAAEPVAPTDAAPVKKPAAKKPAAKKPAAEKAIAEPAENVEKIEKTEPPLTRRYNKKGRRRGKYAYAAPLGLLISLLSIIGAIAVVTTVVGWIADATDTTYLHEEMYYYLEPLLVYPPEAFEDALEADQDAFLNAAAYRVMVAEQVRMLREKDESCNYPVDDNGRIAVPQEEIEASYRALFGPQAKPTHRTIADSDLEYDEGDGCYYVPFSVPTLGSRPFVVSIDRGASEYEVRIGFVPAADIQLDQYGNELPPTQEMATHFQIFTLQREDEGYYIISCQDEVIKN